MRECARANGDICAVDNKRACGRLARVLDTCTGSRVGTSRLGRVCELDVLSVIFVSFQSSPVDWVILAYWWMVTFGDGRPSPAVCAWRS